MPLWSLEKCTLKDVVLSNFPGEMEAAIKAVEANEQIVYLHLDTIRKNILGKEGQALQEQTRQLFINCPLSQVTGSNSYSP